VRRLRSRVSLAVVRVAIRATLSLLLMASVAACANATPRAFGPVNSAEEAKAAALYLTGLQPPVTVVGEVSHGRASELYRGPQGMCASEDQCQQGEARRQRLGWKVYLAGMEHGSDCDVATCPLVKTNQLLVIDELDGTVLFDVQSEGAIGF
jgi:hypothetical protein